MHLASANKTSTILIQPFYFHFCHFKQLSMYELVEYSISTFTITLHMLTVITDTYEKIAKMEKFSFSSFCGFLLFGMRMHLNRNKLQRDKMNEKNEPKPFLPSSE